MQRANYSLVVNRRACSHPAEHDSMEDTDTPSVPSASALSDTRLLKTYIFALPVLPALVGDSHSQTTYHHLSVWHSQTIVLAFISPR